MRQNNDIVHHQLVCIIILETSWTEQGYERFETLSCFIEIMFTKTRFYPNFKSLGDIIDICDISYTYEGGGQIFFTHREGQTFLHRGGDKHFLLEMVVAMMMLMKRWI